MLAHASRQPAPRLSATLGQFGCETWTPPPPLPVEDTFDDFVRHVGGERVATALGQESSCHENADYVFRNSKVIAELKEIATDLQAIVGGQTSSGTLSPAAEKKPAAPETPKVNLPLSQSDNERARGLVELDRKFLLDPAAMPPAASRYVRRRPFLLSEECCRKWRCGYLPRDVGGEDKSGGTMRGKMVYGYLSETGEVLSWFGRDPDFEEKHAHWTAAGKIDREPEKFHFVKGFHRGLELYGQHALLDQALSEKLRAYGLVVVEGPNDAIALDALGVPAVALCSNTVTREQIEKVARLAKELSGGIVTLMLDCDPEGENGVQQVLPLLAEHVPVRLAWSGKMHDGKFKGRQPESLAISEWQEIGSIL